MKKAKKKVTRKASASPAKKKKHLSPKTKVAKVAKKSPQKAAAAPKAPVSPGNVIRKFLEMREAQRKQAAENRQHQKWSDESRRSSHHNSVNVAKFSGPRRRAV